MARTGDLRQDILEETRRLLLEHGYGQLSMRKIAAAVGCTPTSIYLYFDSKDGLIHALIEEGFERLFEQLAQVAGEAGDPRQRFRRLCRSFLQFCIENPEYFQIMFQLHAERMARYPSDKYRRARRNLQLFEEALGEARGGSSKRNAQLDATVVWSLLHGAASLQLAERVDSAIPATRFLEEVVEHAMLILDA